MKERDHEKASIAHYVEMEANGENVTHVERLISTKILSVVHEVWDVRTDADRYWVVTNPTNLYSQDEFKSADYVLSFHLGLGLRVAERSRTDIDEERASTVEVPWRKFDGAVEAFNEADEAEAYQAVGIHCREALIALGRVAAARIPGEVLSNAPKVNDFKRWADAGAEHLTAGRLRSYLKTISERAWDLVVWLQHYENATTWDAELVLEATSHAIQMFGMAFVRAERGSPPRCPRCGSYRVDKTSGILDANAEVQWHEQVCAACEHRWGYERITWAPGEGWVTLEDPPS